MNTVSANKIKTIRSLREKKFRDDLGLFTVEGEKMVSEALASDFDVVEVFRTEDIGEETMSRMSHFSSPSPALAVLRKPDMRADESFFGKRLEAGLYLALDSIKDPGNLGTILRTADWFGISGVFASEDSVDIFNPKVVQSTMGAVFRVRFRYCDIPRLCDKVKSEGGSVYGTFLDGRNIYEENLDTGENSPSVIVIGNESAGISPEVGEKVTSRIFIPPYPLNDSGSESLNAAVATAVTVSEFRRRKRKQL